MVDASEHLARYHRQMLLPGIGRDGQRRLREGHALLVGCGALGCAIADMLTRAGIGQLTIVDRDVVELTNLQRQALFDENHAAAAVPKAEAARDRLQQINSEVKVHAHVEDFNAGNAEGLLGDAQLILDGLDNFQTRYLLNDLAVQHAVPFIHGGAVGTVGTSMVVLPRPHPLATPCLRCVFPEMPPPASAATCDTAGVLGPLVQVIAAHQTVQAIKFFTGNLDALDRSLLSIDVWTNRIGRTDLAGGIDEHCPCCGQRSFTHLSGSSAPLTTTLCGRNAVQVNPSATERATSIDLPAVARRLASHGRFTFTATLLRGTFDAEKNEQGDAIELMLFPTGRAILKNVDRADLARSIYARYVGS